MFLRFFKQTARSRGIKHATTAKSGERRRGLLGRSPSLFDPFHELADETERQHPMAAHRSQFERVAIGHAVGLAEKPKRILDTVPLQTCGACAFLSFVERRADVDGKPEIGILQFFDESRSVIAFVKYCGNCS